MADRLSIDKKVNDRIISSIDNLKFMRLDKNSIERIELFLFAMAVGVKLKKRTPLTVIHGFILESAFIKNPSVMSTIYSLLVNEMRMCNNEEKISDKDEAFFVAQEYANTGFMEIESWIKRTEDDGVILWELIEDLNEKYDELFPED